MTNTYVVYKVGDADKPVDLVGYFNATEEELNKFIDLTRDEYDPNMTIGEAFNYFTDKQKMIVYWIMDAIIKEQQTGDTQ